MLQRSQCHAVDKSQLTATRWWQGSSIAPNGW